MPRIASPTPVEVAEYPREYAVFTQIPGALEGSVEAKVLSEYVEGYGSGKMPSGDELTFAEMAAALRRKGSPIEGTGNTIAWASRDAHSKLTPYKFDRRMPGDDDVVIQISYVGICHTDLHQMHNDWGNALYPIPMVPGHEIVGVIVEVGANAGGHFKIGDHAGIGCFIRACRSCHLCKLGDDQYCERRVFTYNDRDWGEDNTPTQGGYSNRIVVDHRFAVTVPKTLPLLAAAPLLCAGITTYSPMKHFGVDKPGMAIGVVGLGGLGHMAVKFGKGFGQEVTVISTSPSKEREARQNLGADCFVVSRDDKQMAAAVGTLDAIIDTVAAQHDITALLPLLKTNGKLILLGVPPEPHSFPADSLLFKRLSICGSLIGGIQEMQDMLDFCGEKGIVCDVEEITMDYVNTAMERLMKNDVHYRFSINVQKSLIPE